MHEQIDRLLEWIRISDAGVLGLSRGATQEALVAAVGPLRSSPLAQGVATPVDRKRWTNAAGTSFRLQASATDVLVATMRMGERPESVSDAAR